MNAPDRVRAAFDSFFLTPLDEVLAKHRTTSPDTAAIALFHDVAKTVPAYAHFLGTHGVDPERVRSIDAFRELPLATRESYLDRYPLAERCRGGRLESCDLLAFSSGSTGEPRVWPRFVTDELPIARRFEQVFADSFRLKEKRTLAVVCFPLGTWVGGLYTTGACRHLAAKGFPLTVVAPGNNKEEILRVLSALAGMFEEVVLLGYPPFLKDVVDTGVARGVDFTAIKPKLVLAGEVVSEEWRERMAARLGGTSPLCDFASLYGTADAGVLGNETPLSIAIRRFLSQRPDAARTLFGESRLPTLVQYDPLSRYFEASGSTLLFSGDNGVPLVRYHIADTGGVFGYEELLAKMSDLGFDFGDVARAGAPTPRAMPFVYVFGRSQFTVSYFGANVFPENVTVALERADVAPWTTGKFVLETHEDEQRDVHLALSVELAPGEAASEERRNAVAIAVRDEIVRLNSEFRNYVPRERQVPRVTLKPHGDSSDFPLGVKHRYTRRG